MAHNRTHTTPVTDAESVRDLAPFPIGELSELTGVNTVTIRAWERRFSLLKPQRTAKGHRLYTSGDVRRVERILMLVARGVPLKEVKSLLEDSGDAQDLDDLTPDQGWPDQIRQLLAASASFSSTRVEAILNEQLIKYPPRLCLEKLIKPVFERLLQDKRHCASATFLESEILRYTLVRLSAKKSTKGKPVVTLSHGDKASLWRMAVIGLELPDAGYRVQLICQTLSESSWLSMANSTESMIHVYYQDGFWKQTIGQEIAGRLTGDKNLVVCGTAPLVFNLKRPNQVFADIEQFVAYQATQSNR